MEMEPSISIWNRRGPPNRPSQSGLAALELGSQNQLRMESYMAVGYFC